MIDGERESIATATLAKAFSTDPFIQYSYPDEDVRRRRLPQFFALTWRVAAALGTCDLTTNGEAAAIWMPPDQWRIPRHIMLRNSIRMARAYGAALPRVLDCLGRMEAVHPIEPHWYLMTLGTDPVHQGQGHAHSLLQPRLAQCDAKGLPAYLESGSADNIPFYSKLDFVVLGEVTIPGGPSFWPMWRSPLKLRRSTAASDADDVELQ